MIQAYNVTSLETVKAQVPAILSLCGKGVVDIKVLDATAPRPAGCVAYPVSSSAAVLLHVKGRVDMDAEIEKAKKKAARIRATIEKQTKIFADPGYKEKVTLAIQEADRKKVADMEAEARGFEETIKQFEQLKLE